MIPQLLCLIRKIIRVNSDAVASYKAREKVQEIPFGASRLKNRLRINPKLVENNGEFIHKRNINISLAVFNYLGRLRHFNGISPVYSGFHYKLIYLCYSIQRLFVHPGNNLHNRFQAVNLVAGVNTFRRIAYFEIHTAC